MGGAQGHIQPWAGLGWGQWMWEASYCWLAVPSWPRVGLGSAPFLSSPRPSPGVRFAGLWLMQTKGQLEPASSPWLFRSILGHLGLGTILTEATKTGHMELCPKRLWESRRDLNPAYKSKRAFGCGFEIRLPGGKVRKGIPKGSGMSKCPVNIPGVFRERLAVCVGKWTPFPCQ